MNRYCLAVVGVLVGSLVVTAQEKPTKPGKDEPVQVYIELCQVEVDVLKLRRMGIDWQTLAEQESVANNPAWLRKLAELMVENNLAQRHANPQLVTMAGRKAEFDIGTTRETVLPRMVDGKIVVEVSLETYDPPTKKQQAAKPAARGEQRSSLSTVVTCEPGQTRLLGGDVSTSKNSSGEVTKETVTLTFLMADTKMPELEQGRKGKAAELRSAGAVLVGDRPLGTVVEIKEAVRPRR
jgi:hypothetical protein